MRATRRKGWATVAVLALAVGGPACGDGDSPLMLGPVTELRPLEAGTYRLVGTERDSRTDQSFELVETYQVERAFERDGNEHQITHLDERGTRFRSTWETSLQEGGAFRVRESAGDASWAWEPPLQTSALPIEVGSTWSSHSSATVPDLSGTRRQTEITVKGEVEDSTTVVVAGKVVPVFEIVTTVTTDTTDTERATGDVEQRTTVRTTRSWFSPEHMQTVKSFSRTEVRSDDDGYSDYTLTRAVKVETLGPLRGEHP